MKKLFLILAFLIFLPLQVWGAFTQTVYYRLGGAALNSGEEINLAKYDRLVLNRFHYNDIGGDTWNALKTLNPSIKIYLYQLGRATDVADDPRTIPNLHSIARYTEDKDHTDGALYTDHYPAYFALSAGGSLIYNPAYTNEVLLKFGSSNVQDYWLEATINDIVCSDWSSSNKTTCNSAQNWVADGVYADVCTISRTSLSQIPADYSTNELWSDAMNDFIDAIASGLAGKSQLFAVNRTFGGGTLYTPSFWLSAYSDLDAKANPPAAVLEEGAFCTLWGSGDVQFYSSSRWKMYVDAISSTQNSETWFQASSNLDPDESGVDNYGQSLTFWDVLWYALGSYYIAKNESENNSYFSFSIGYNDEPWFDEYDNIDLGNAIGTYYTKSVDGKTLYLRKFQKGYIIVNPQVTPDLSDVNYSTDLGITETCREITHSNMGDSWDGISTSTTFATFKAHRSKVLYIGESLVISGADPIDDESGVSITKDLAWSNPGATVSVDVYFEKNDTTPDVKVVDAGVGVETYDTGTMDNDSDYYWRVDVNHAGGTETGSVYHFHTIVAGGSCAGDFSDGDNEAFEDGAGTFCTTDWSLTNPNSVIDTFDTAWFNTGAKSCSITCNSGTPALNSIEADIGSSVDDVYVRWYFKINTDIVDYMYYQPRFDNAAQAYQLRITMRDSPNQIHLFGGGKETTDYFSFSTNTKYRAEIHFNRNSTSEMKLFDATGTQLQTNDSLNSLTLTPTPNVAIRYIEWQDHNGTASDLIYYIDDIEMSTVDWVGPLALASAPSVDDIVLINDIDGTPSITENPTASWTGSTDRYIGLKLSEQITNLDVPGNSRLKLMTGPLTIDYTWVYFNRQVQIGASWYLVYIFDPPQDNYGDRSVDLRFENIEALDCNGASLSNGYYNLCDDDNDDLPRADIGGTGTITLAVPYPTDTPKELDATNTLEQWLLDGGYLFSDDNVAFTANATDPFDISAYDGTSGHEIVLDGQGYVIGGSQTAGVYTIWKRFIHGSTVTLGANDTHKYSLIPSGDTINVPETATGCTISNDTIIGTLDIDETVTVENTFAVAVDLAGVGAGETATFNDCGFVQSEAQVDATLGAGATSYNAGCQFSVIAANCFLDYAGGDYDLHAGSPLTNAGGDTGADTDIDGFTTPFGSDHDIGCYECQGSGGNHFRMDFKLH